MNDIHRERKRERERLCVYLLMEKERDCVFICSFTEIVYLFIYAFNCLFLYTYSHVDLVAGCPKCR